MRRCLYVLLGGLLLSATAGAWTSPLTSGPALSPVSFKAVESAKVSLAREFAPRRNILGVTKQPVSVKLMQLEDQRPYGEIPQRMVWLARYEEVRVQTSDGSRGPAVVALSLAFDASTNELLCAFTDPAPRWALPPHPPLNPETHTAKEGWGRAPAHYDELRSTVTEVLGVLWRRYGADPSKAGQIVLRPRFVSNPTFVKTEDRSPLYPPSNVWVVEVLGTVLIRDPFTTLVAHIRDSDLVILPGSLL